MQIFDYLNKDGLLHLIRKIMGRDVDLTQAEYDALPESKNSDGKNYYIYDSDITVTAEEVGFDDSASGSTSANSQQALDELFAADKKMNESLENLNSNLSELGVVANSKASREFDVTTSQNASVSIPTNSRIGLFVATNAYEISLGIYGEFSGDFSISWITNQLNCSYSSKKITIPSAYTRYLFIYGGV